MHLPTQLRATWMGAVVLASFAVACSGAAPQSSNQPSGPIDGEIPGTGANEGSGAGGATGGAMGPGTATGGSGGGGGATSTGGGGGSGATSSTGGAGGSGGAVPVEPGTLTAGAWDDNRNFDLFLSYRTDVHATGAHGLLDFTVPEHQASHDASAAWLTPHKLLDVALVLDTTGSMGDEMAYLKAELIAISAKIESLHPDAQQRWSLIVYKDLTDVYVVRWFGFRDGVDVIQQKLAEQSAGGGGDFPESPDMAFEQLNKLYWREGADVARLAFWVADAPEHPDKAEAFTDALRRTRDLGIHVYPIASSGIDEPTELDMRSAAQITGGRYLFLTDDSGVGNSHKQPSIPCYFVTKLDDAMVRMVDIEMSGKYHEPDPGQILRTGGDPQNGACVLDSGDQVVAY